MRFVFELQVPTRGDVMLKRMRFYGVVGVLVTAIMSMGMVFAQEVAVAPVPPALGTAKTVFISNAGADAGLFPHPFSGGADRGYNQFYAMVKSWGRFELVNDPAQADLVFELQLHAPNGPQNADKTKGASDPLPMFRLTILDRKTHYVLWALTESIEQANLQKTHDHNFDDALGLLGGDLKAIVSAAGH
jgi:hypothetical protein